ncbi:MAG TPA: LysR substrate-binding domain-containing protein, partial [Flavisolibacter sp.]|nr:LysR substrate-binding domain-containing protein [Flavisolibacter sp.]
FITQPAISKHIKLLEFNYKSPLFDRKGNSIALTPTGEILYRHLQEALQIQRQIRFEISTLQNNADAIGQLKLGASTTIALYILPKILSGFHRQYPKLEIQLMNRNSENITTALLNNQIDIGIIEVEHKITSIAYQPFMTDEIIPVCAANSPIARLKTINIHDLPQYPIALRERGSGTLSALTLALQKHHLNITDLNVKVRLGGTEALKNFLLADPSMGFLPHKSVLKELAAGELRALDIQGLEIKRNFFFIQRQGTEEFPISKHFMRFAKSHYNH